MKTAPLLQLLAIIATGTAFAAEPPKTSTKPAAPTTDHSESHAAHAAPDAFAALDTNKDGVLSKAELSKHRMAAHASMVDANKDGVLNRSEFAALQGM